MLTLATYGIVLFHLHYGGGDWIFGDHSMFAQNLFMGVFWAAEASSTKGTFDARLVKTLFWFITWMVVCLVFWYEQGLTDGIGLFNLSIGSTNAMTTLWFAGTTLLIKGMIIPARWANEKFRLVGYFIDLCSVTAICTAHLYLPQHIWNKTVLMFAPVWLGGRYKLPLEYAPLIIPFLAIVESTISFCAYILMLMSLYEIDSEALGIPRFPYQLGSLVYVAHVPIIINAHKLWALLGVDERLSISNRMLLNGGLIFVLAAAAPAHAEIEKALTHLLTKSKPRCMFSYESRGTPVTIITNV